METQSTPATSTSTPPSAPKAPKAPKAPTPTPPPAQSGFSVLACAAIPAKAAAQVRAAFTAAATAGLKVPTPEEVLRMGEWAAREAAHSSETGKGRVSGRGGAEAVAKWDAKAALQKAGLPGWLPTLACGLALLKAASDYRRSME